MKPVMINGGMKRICDKFGRFYSFSDVYHYLFLNAGGIISTECWYCVKISAVRNGIPCGFCPISENCVTAVFMPPEGADLLPLLLFRVLWAAIRVFSDDFIVFQTISPFTFWWEWCNIVEHKGQCPSFCVECHGRRSCGSSIRTISSCSLWAA